MKLIWPSLAISPPSPHFNVLLIKPHEYSNEMAMNINKMRWICYLGSCHISRPSVEGAAVGTLKLAVYLTILHRSSLPRVRPTVTYILSYITTIKQSLPYYIFINIRLVSAHPASSISNWLYHLAVKTPLEASYRISLVVSLARSWTSIVVPYLRNITLSLTEAAFYKTYMIPFKTEQTIFIFVIIYSITLVTTSWPCL